MTAPGIAWILADTIASEIGDTNRLPTARKPIGYTGLCPRVYQSGDTDRRRPPAQNGPNQLRSALIEAAHTAARTSYHRPIIERTRDRHGRRRGSAPASPEIAHRLSETIWWMLTRSQPFAPAGALSVSDRTDGPSFGLRSRSKPQPNPIDPRRRDRETSHAHHPPTRDPPASGHVP
jgi:transposase